MSEQQRRAAARNFVAQWADKGYEKGHTHAFWLTLLRDICGVDNPECYIRFEDQVLLSHISFIDAYLPGTKVMIEQKSSDKDLRKAAKQSDGTMLTPFQQVKRYADQLPNSQRPRWIILCNFVEMLIYDLEHPHQEPQTLIVADLEREYYRLDFLVADVAADKLRKEKEISLKAGELVGRLYDKLLSQYRDPSSEASLQSLNKLCVRLVFCLYAEDAGVFGKRDQFVDYLRTFHHSNVRTALIELFKILDTRPEDRDPYLNPNLLAFPYVNGGLFSDEHIEIPSLTEEIIDLLEQDCSLNFDWSGISPTIFGGVFESTLNPETRRHGGMHYTSIENIHRVIDPLFLDALTEELNAILDIKQLKQRSQRLREYHDRLASLRFFDPACGSGNFLTETYLSLRRLENIVIRALYGDHAMLNFGADDSPIKVSISQFYGIEINDFAAIVAQTALWISEAQMQRETEDIIQADLSILPLRNYDTIHHADALTTNWADIVPTDSLSYIIGNPPFVGARNMDAQQKEALINVFGKKWKNVGNLDFVCAWYKKAADMMRGTDIRAALVSTNSVCQGETVANLWQPLMEDDGVHIDFAHRTFRWDSESNQKAHVHCVIVGFSCAPTDRPKVIYTNDVPEIVSNINGYLMDGDNVFVGSRNNPICNVPSIGIGNKPIDGGFYLFTEEEMHEFISREPKSEPYFRPFYGAQEFINRKPRYCLWLGNCSPAELRAMPECLKRVQSVREYRLKSPSAGTRKLADTPTRFHVENMPEGNYLLIPRVSSERRFYVPMGFMNPEMFSSDSVHIIPDATLYHFGVLTSSVHMAWMRAVCGRLEMRYRYSKDVVYNNFPWPEVTDEQRLQIERTAQAILDARNLYPDSSLADLYDDIVMPAELRRAHRDNDRAVCRAFGFDPSLAEPAIVASLLNRYANLVEK